jgi:single-stranded DNA-binding protein
MGMNYVVLSGNITKEAELKDFTGSTLRTFSLAVSGVKWNKEKGAEDIETTWANIEQFLPGPKQQEWELYPGDAVMVIGELSTRRTNTGTTHTRILAKSVTVERRGRAAASAFGWSTGGASPQSQPQQQPPAPGSDPWAVPQGGQQGGWQGGPSGQQQNPWNQPAGGQSQPWAQPAAPTTDEPPF